MNSSAVIAVDKPLYADVIKVGLLRKGKRGKKRFFVLHQDGYKSPARIDCYDSEKRFYQGAAPKLSVPLKQCFNINKKEDSKLKHCIAIYTTSDCLLLGCEDEHDQEAWLQTLLGVLVNTQSTGEVDDFRRPTFEHVWNVKIQKNRGITEKTPHLSGLFRFCLDSYSVYFYRANMEDEYYEFPLVYISNYGHQGNMFFLRVGRSALTGSGELWMNTEDVLDAANIHETMKQILEENHELRQRNMAVEPRASFYAVNSMRSNSLSGVGVQGSSRELLTGGGGSGAVDSRSRSISESEKTLQTLRSHLCNLKSRSATGVALAHCLHSSVNSYPTAGAALSYSRSASHSPSQRHNFMLTGSGASDQSTDRPAGYSTDSVATASTCSDFEHARMNVRRISKPDMELELIHRSSNGRFVCSSPVLNGRSQGGGSDYCSNGGGGNGVGGIGSHDSVSSTLITHCAEVHSPATDYLGNLRRMTLDSGCVDAVSPRDPYLMPQSYSSERIADYTPMAPSPSGKSSSSKLTDGCSWNADEVPPRCTEFDGPIPPSRAYSCGSKPSTSRCNKHQPLSWLKKWPLPYFDDRKRAHSFGNWNKYVSQKNGSYFAVSDSSDSCLRQRSDSCGGSDESVSTSGCRVTQVLRARLLDCKFSSGSEDMVEMDFGGGVVGGATGLLSFGRSHSGSLDSTDSISRSRANSTGGTAVALTAVRQTWLPKVEQITEQELRPSARLVHDLLEREPAPSMDAGTAAAAAASEYVPMSPCKSTTATTAEQSG